MLNVNTKVFKTLATWFSIDIIESENLNLQNCIEKIKTILEIWRQRQLSRIGRIIIIKTLIISQITHLLSTIYIPDPF